MTLYNTFTTHSARSEKLRILYSVHAQRPELTSGRNFAEDLGIQIESVYSVDRDEMLVPFGLEPDEYKEKVRFYEEAELDFRQRYEQ